MHNPPLALIGAALMPMIVGMLWYSKFLFGNSWMRANRFHPEDMKRGNMVLIFGLALLFSFMLAMGMIPFVVHQAGLGSIVEGKYKTPESEAWLKAALEKYGTNYRTFGHGAMHGGIASVFIALPILGVIAAFERRGWKYVLIHLGFWFFSMALMGGIICQFF